MLVIPPDMQTLSLSRLPVHPVSPKAKAPLRSKIGCPESHPALLDADPRLRSRFQRHDPIRVC